MTIEDLDKKLSQIEDELCKAVQLVILLRSKLNEEYHDTKNSVA